MCAIGERQLIETVPGNKPLFTEACLWFNDKLDHGTYCPARQKNLQAAFDSAKGKKRLEKQPATVVQYGNWCSCKHNTERV